MTLQTDPRADEEPRETVLLPGGTLVYYQGMPFRLVHDCVAFGRAATLQLAVALDKEAAPPIEERV